jgi:hypothetical protein
MNKSSTKLAAKRKRASRSTGAKASASSDRSSDHATMRSGRIEEMDRSFDIAYWQQQGDAAIFRAAWELVAAYWRDRGRDPDELGLQRTVEAFQRP